MIRSARLEGERRGYEAAKDGTEDVFPEQFESDEEFLDTFFAMAMEYEEGTREVEGFDPAEEVEGEEMIDEVWESFSVGVRLGIKRRWQEIMGMFRGGE